MPTSSSRAPARRNVVRMVVAWRAKASCAICRTRTGSRESFVGRREAEGRGAPRRLRPVADWPTIFVAGAVGPGAAGVAGPAAAVGAEAEVSAAGGAGDSAGDWGSGSTGAGPVAGSVTFHLIGGAGARPAPRRGGAAGRGGGGGGGGRGGGGGGGLTGGGGGVG